MAGLSAGGFFVLELNLTAAGRRLSLDVKSYG
jgi:hypothetical protein